MVWEMKVLHVNDVAGVGGLLVQGLKENGIKADLAIRERHPYRFPDETVLNVTLPVFLLYILRLSRGYDIVHVHSLSYRMIFNVDIFALKTVRAKLVLHLHGTELRECYSKPWTKAALQICDKVIMSTIDLLPYYPKAVWLPTPIDPLFKTLDNPRRYGKALYFKKWYEPEKERFVRMKCEKMGLELTVPRKIIPYSEMPLFLNQFEVFFDRFNIPSLSKTAIEALACGCKVISWKGLVTNSEEILKNHSFEVVTEKLVKIYEEVLVKKDFD